MSAEPVALGKLSQVALESQDRGTENNFRWFTVASSRKTKSKPTKKTCEVVFYPCRGLAGHGPCGRGSRRLRGKRLDVYHYINNIIIQTCLHSFCLPSPTASQGSDTRLIPSKCCHLLSEWTGAAWIGGVLGKG